MSSQALQLSALDVATSGGLVLVAGLSSLALGLGLERQLLVASLRTVVQLLLIGQVLTWVFGATHPIAVAGLVAVMVLAASREATARPSRKLAGSLGYAVLTLVVTGLLTSWVVTGLVVGASPWWTPRYLIPLLGMILGNCLTGISLCLDRLLAGVVEQRGEIEQDLAMGATREEALRPVIAAAVRKGMIPILNSMAVVGLVSLPGMMTGQILAGADPAQAVRYQMVVMFMLAGATAAGCVIIAHLAARALSNERHQLRLEGVSGEGQG